MVYTSGDLTAVRYFGDNNTSLYKRDVLAYTLGNLVTIKHFFNASNLTSHSAITTLTYDGSDNLIATSYLEV
jgi:YD repeat-containing protein